MAPRPIAGINLVPRTTNQLSSWWDWEGREPAHRPEGERREAEKDWTASNRTVRFTARQALHSLEREGIISSEVRKNLSSDGRCEFWWTLTPRGEEIAKRIDDELGETPAELFISADLKVGNF